MVFVEISFNESQAFWVGEFKELYAMVKHQIGQLFNQVYHRAWL